jgi:hypothetical protein
LRRPKLPIKEVKRLMMMMMKLFVESQAAKRVNCVQKTLLDYWKK